MKNKREENFPYFYKTFEKYCTGSVVKNAPVALVVRLVARTKSAGNMTGSHTVVTRNIRIKPIIFMINPISIYKTKLILINNMLDQ